MERIDVDRVMAIAAETFAQHGFTGVGMREVARDCGVSLQTIYYYFGSKEKLFEAVCRDAYHKALSHISGGMDFDAPLETQVEQLGGRLYDLLTGDPTLFLLLRRDLIEGSNAQSEFHSRLQYDALMNIFKRVLSSRFQEPRVDQLAFTASSFIFGYCEFVVITRMPEKLAERRQELIVTLKKLIG
jgi:AcrR family transcriptional regulator